jgi:uncharacterized protein
MREWTYVAQSCSPTANLGSSWAVLPTPARLFARNVTHVRCASWKHGCCTVRALRTYRLYSFIRNNPLVALLLTLAALAGMSGAGVIVLHSYRAMHSQFEADPPSELLAAPEKTGIAGLRSVSFATGDHLMLSAWYKPPTNGATVVITHGTNSDRSTMLPELRMLAASGYGVLAFDWPGLGHSEGSVRWDAQARRALIAAVDWLSAQPGVDPRRIGGLGFSIGGFIMAQVAAVDPRLRAVVLEAPLPDFDDYIRVHNTRWGVLSEWPARWVLRNSDLLDTNVEPMNLIDKIAPRPVLILGGSLDPEIPPALVTKLFEAAHEPKTLWIVSQAHHGGYAEVAPVQYPRRLADFFSQNLGASLLVTSSGFGGMPASSETTSFANLP